MRCTELFLQERSCEGAEVTNRRRELVVRDKQTRYGENGVDDHDDVE